MFTCCFFHCVQMCNAFLFHLFNHTLVPLFIVLTVLQCCLQH
uniref:Uncharacterized protein n=1 Tax=Anguilla anguilla TaxID=7936 RepID=A0A0E9XGZ1_ANGAN